ncbi:MAG: thioredoxin domain-containing protein [Candidatus Kerfeldbacteria bacterium]|nr:thioredoxin domain-containing protein [Candidatus Kerfeldbacteria bacterium]
METDKRTPVRENSFFQDPQKLTFALGLSSGLAVMAIAGFVVMAVKGGSSSTTSYKNTNTPVVANTGTGSVPDAATVASAIGLDAGKFKSCLDSGKYADRVNKDVTEGGTIGVNGTPSTFVNGTQVVGAVPYAQLKSAIDAALAGTKGTVNVPPINDNDHVIGGKNAKVQVIEYSDFECPFCKQFAPSIEQALQEYGDKIAVVFRHFPLTSIHPLAQKLAEGSECAAELGGKDKFWEFHDANFQV